MAECTANNEFYYPDSSKPSQQRRTLVVAKYPGANIQPLPFHPPTSHSANNLHQNRDDSSAHAFLQSLDASGLLVLREMHFLNQEEEDHLSMRDELREKSALEGEIGLHESGTDRGIIARGDKLDYGALHTFFPTADPFSVIWFSPLIFSEFKSRLMNLVSSLSHRPSVQCKNSQPFIFFALAFNIFSPHA